MRAYMVVMDGDLQAPNIQPQIGKGIPYTPLVIDTQVGGPHINCKQTLGMMSSNSSWRTFAKGSLSGNLMHPLGMHH